MGAVRNVRCWCPRRATSAVAGQAACSRWRIVNARAPLVSSAEVVVTARSKASVQQCRSTSLAPLLVSFRYPEGPHVRVSSRPRYTSRMNRKAGPCGRTPCPCALMSVSFTSGASRPSASGMSRTRSTLRKIGPLPVRGRRIDDDDFLDRRLEQRGVGGEDAGLAAADNSPGFLLLLRREITSDRRDVPDTALIDRSPEQRVGAVAHNWGAISPSTAEKLPREIAEIAGRSRREGLRRRRLSASLSSIEVKTRRAQMSRSGILRCRRCASALTLICGSVAMVKLHRPGGLGLGNSLRKRPKRPSPAAPSPSPSSTPQTSLPPAASPPPASRTSRRSCR